MANLETLELTIRANALSASRGLGKLISSLTSLSTRVGKSVGGLRLLNAELEKLSGYSGIKLPRMNLTGMSSGRGGIAGVERETRAIRARAGVMKEFAKLPANSFRSWMYGPRPLPTMTNLMAGSAGMPSESARRSANPQWYVQPGSREWNAGIAARNAALERNAGRTFASDPNPEKLAMAAKGDIEGIREWTRDIQAVREGKTVWSGEVKRLLDHLNAGSPTQNLAGFINQTMGIGAEPKSAQDSASVFMEQLRDRIPFIERAKNAIGKLKEGFGKLRENLGGIIPHFKLFNRMLRIAQTMMIRMAIRALFAGMKEGFQNYYQYAKATSNTFAKEMDSVSSAWSQLKNQMGGAMAGAISAALPAVTALCNALVTAFNYASQLFALLSGKSSWSKATTQVKEFGDSVNKANGGGGGGGGMKELLANFDELNVIASESGGGGGGGGAADTAEEFTNMFEEMFTFDKGIRDAVSWLEDHLPIVNGLVAMLAAKLLGLPTSIAIGIGLLVTGISWASEAGYDIGKNGLTKENLGEAIGGVLTSTLGGALIGWKLGGAYGALIGAYIGFSVSLVFLGVGIEKGRIEKLYGDIKLTAEQIEYEVKKLFKINVEVELEQAMIRKSALDRAKKEIQNQIYTVLSDYRMYQINPSAETAEALAKSVQATVDAANTLLKEYSVMVVVGFGFSESFSDPEFVQKFTLENITGLSDYVTKLGEDIGHLLDQKIGDSIELQGLVQKLNNVTLAMAQGRAGASFASSMSFGYGDVDWGNVDYNTIRAYYEQYTSAMSDLTEAAQTNAQETKATLGAVYAGMLQRELDNPGSYTAEALEAARAAYEDYDVYGSVTAFVNAASEEGRNIFAENMATAFNAAAKRLGGANGFSPVFKTDLQSGEMDIREWVNRNVAMALGWQTEEDQQFFINILDLVGIEGWDILELDAKRKFIGTMLQALGHGSDAYKQIKEGLNLTIDDFMEIRGWDGMDEEQKKTFAKSLVGVFSDEEIKEFIKREGNERGEDFGYAMTQVMFDSLISFLENNGLNVLAMEEYHDTLFNMVDTFGLEKSIDLIMELIEGAGNNAETYVQNWDLIAPMIDTYGIETSAELLKASLEVFGDDASFILENWDLFAPYIDMDNLEDSMYNMKLFVELEESDINAILDNWDLVAPMIDERGFNGSVTTLKQLAVSYGVDIATIVKNWQFIAPDIDATNVKASARYIMKELDGIFSEKKYITVGLTTDGSTVTTNMQSNNGKTVVGLTKSMYKATGAYGIPAGDVFVANENGAELVGSINGKTSVANQQQIIDGISQGVATANSEQNALLRQQNELLREILKKENSVRLGASVALGRTVQQSLDMFSAVGGR